MRLKKPLPVKRSMCATCPWQVNSPYKGLVDYLTKSATTEATRICHSTGSSAIHRRTGKPSAACKGAREITLRAWHRMGFIEAPTEDAWAKKCLALNIRNGILGETE